MRPLPHNNFLRSLGLPLIGLTAIGLSAAFSVPVEPRSPESRAATINFPIEVMSARYPHVETVDVNLTGSADAIEITANNLNFGGKGRMRVGSGPWVTFDNSSVNCLAKYESFGCIGYPGTIVFRLSYSVGSGNQTVQFELSRTEGFSSGYRVLDMRFLKGGSPVGQGDTIRHGVLGQGQISGNATRGGQLFDQRNRWVDHPGGELQIAACNDCHTEGRDLKYFGFSDHSIVVRTEFHGGSETDGADIAAYIASLNAPTHGTPWDPPYQPGPGMDQKPIVEWAAGAGLGAIIPESATRADIFGADGITRDDFDRLPNLREIRLSEALPDWNQWLPRQWPGECHSGSAWADVMTSRDEMNAVGSAGDPQDFQTAVQRFSLASSHLKNNNGSCGSTDQEAITAEWSALAWQLVQVWYAHNAYGMEDKADRIDGYGPARSWIQRGRYAFNLGPHIANVNGLGNPPFRYGSPSLDSHMTHLWYQLQVVINPGLSDARASAQTPVDWGYQNAFLQGRSSPYRVVASRLTQLRAMSDYPCRVAGGDVVAGTAICLGDQASNPWWLIDHDSGLPNSDALRITSFGLDWYLSRLEAVPEFERGDATGQWKAASYNPETGDQKHNRAYDIADMWWVRSETLKDMGVPDAITRRWDALGEKLWPLARWESLSYPGNPNLSPSDPNGSGPAPPPEPEPEPEPVPESGGTEQGIVFQAGWNMVSSYISPATPNIEDVFADIEGDIEIVKDGDGNQYHPASGLNTIGNWSPLESYQVYAKAQSTLQLSGESVAPSTPINLAAGWNQIPFLPTGEIAVAQALGSAADKITLLKDFSGRIYYPAFGIDEIGSLRPGQGYKVHTGASLTLVYPSSGNPGKFQSGFDPYGVASSATLVVNVPDYASGLQISAVTESGQQVGQGVASDGMAVLRIVGDDELTSSAVEGAREGEKIALTVFLPGQEEEVEIDPEEVTSALSEGTTMSSISYVQDAVLVVDIGDLPQRVELEQNYPNPFSSSTSIGYTIGRPGDVILEVFNIVGERVAVVVDGEQDHGPHTVSFDASSLASGVYVYRLISAEKVEFKQMILVK